MVVAVPDVAQHGYIGEARGFVKKDGTHENGQGRVFGTADMHHAGQRHTAFNDSYP